MQLWTPKNLIITPKMILDPSTASWSGSNWGSTANSGSWGGNIVADTGTPVKGTQLNSLDTVSFSGANSLSLASVAWPASTDIFVFAVFKASASQALIAQNWNFGTATTGWVIYPRADAAGTVTGNGSWAISDFFSFGQGFGSGTTAGYMIDSQPWVGGTHRIMTWNSCSSQLLRVDGTTETLANSSTGTVPAVTESIYIGESHGGNTFSEAFIGEIAYLLIIAGNPTAAEYQRLEGWAAWKYGLTASLPSGHTYKNSPPAVPTAFDWPVPRGKIINQFGFINSKCNAAVADVLAAQICM